MKITSASIHRLSQPPSRRLLYLHPPQSHNNSNISFICRETYPRKPSFLFVVQNPRSMQTIHLYNNPLRLVCQISRTLRMFPSLLNCNAFVFTNDYGSEGGAYVKTTSSHTHTNPLFV